jgi:hypothetical protein
LSIDITEFEIKRGNEKMSLSSTQVKKLLQTSKPLQFKQIALSLMYTRLKNLYQKSSTPDTLNACTSQLNDLFAKFGNAMAEDYALLTSI